MPMETTNTQPTYQSLSDIRLRKAQLLTDIMRDSNRARRIWDNMVHPKKNTAQPKRRFSSLLTTGVGVVDGALLAWKLYRKFGGSASSLRSFLRK